MKRWFFIFLLLCISTGQLKAQFLDSIQAALTRKGRFQFDFNSRNSFIGNNDAHIFGFMMGVCFDRRFATGGGFNFLSTTILQKDILEGQPITKSLSFSFLSYYVEYLFKITKHWELDIPLSIGVGTSSYTYQLNSIPVTENERFVMPIEPSVELDYDFNKYFGVYIQAGYRLMLVNNNEIIMNFNSPTYDFGVLLYPLEIYAGIFPKTKLAHMIEDN
jgi:hypothetical protein